MSEHVEEIRLPDDFSGHVRLFPLPRLVLFPNIVQPLHIFEPRYCDMLAEAMLDDGLITLATLREGWEPAADAMPPVSPLVCIGKVFSHQTTEENRHNILLVGIRRARIVEELDVRTAYRQALVEVIDDYYDPNRNGDREFRQRKLVSVYKSAFPAVSAAGSGLTKILKSGIPLGPLTDIISYSVDLPIETKEMLLGQANVDLRCDVLSEMLATWKKTAAQPPAKSPGEGSVRGNDGEDYVPPFSLN